MRAAAPFPVGSRIRVADRLRRRGAAPHPAGGAARSRWRISSTCGSTPRRRPGRSGSSRKRTFFGAGPETDWSGKTDFSGRSSGGRSLRKSTRCGPGATRTVTAPWRGSTPERRIAAGVVELHTGLLRRHAGRKGGPQPAVRSHAQLRPGTTSTHPSALILRVGDRDNAEEDGTNFTPRIVRYAGMHPLPAGERWGYPSGEAAYPLAAFHFAGDAAAEGFTLCFEDRDGQTGTAPLLRPPGPPGGRPRTDHPLAAARAPRVRGALRARHGSARHPLGLPHRHRSGRRDGPLLHAVGAYDPAKASARCTFDRLPKD